MLSKVFAGYASDSQGITGLNPFCLLNSRVVATRVFLSCRCLGFVVHPVSRVARLIQDVQSIYSQLFSMWLRAWMLRATCPDPAMLAVVSSRIGT